MNSRKKIAKYSSFISVLSQLLTTIIVFINRKFFLEYMGKSCLGVSSTLNQVLGALALSELGVQTVIVYRLFKPLSNGDYSTVNKLLVIFRKIYMLTAVVIMGGSIVLIPFLDVILKGNSLSPFVLYSSWLLMAFASASTYLLSYSRALFLADQQEYLLKLIDMLVNNTLGIVRIVLIIYTQSFILYSFIGVCCAWVSNIIVVIMRRKKYPWFKEELPDKTTINQVKTDVRDIFSGKISGYIFNSTDSIVISSIVGTVGATLAGNYTTIAQAFKLLLSSIASPIQNLGGRYLADNESESAESFLFNYAFVVYVLVLASLYPMGVLINQFISLFYGSDYVLGKVYVIVLVTCMYTDFMQLPLGPFVDGSGLFKEQKLFLAVSAIINIVVSVIGAYIIGIMGVLIGTTIGNMYNWIMRTKVAYKGSLNIQNAGISNFAKKNFIYLVVFYLLYFITDSLFTRWSLLTGILDFLVKGILCEIFVILVAWLVFRNTSEYKYTKDLLVIRMGKSK